MSVSNPYVSKETVTNRSNRIFTETRTEVVLSVADSARWMADDEFCDDMRNRMQTAADALGHHVVLYLRKPVDGGVVMARAFGASPRP